MAKNAFVQSMKTIAESTIHNAGFDKTRSGKVVGKNTLTNTYSVKIDGHVYNTVHVTNDATYNVGDTVKVNMPCNQPSQMIIVSSIFSDVSLGKKIGHAQSLIDAMDEQLEDVKEIDGHIYQLNINSNYTAANSTHTGQILKDGVDVTSATYYNNFRWYLMKSTGKVQITNGISNATLTMQIADYMYGMALILEWIDGNGGTLLRKQIVLFDNNVVKEKIDSVESTATAAKTLADNTEQYFWQTTSGVDTGTHITQVQKDAFTAQPDGYNLLLRSNGVAVRNSLDEMAIFQDDGTYFNGYVSGQWQQIAAYTNTYAQIGSTSSGKNNIRADANGVYFRNGTNTLTQITTSGMDVYTSGNYSSSVAHFGSTSRIGYINSMHLDMASTYLRMGADANNNVNLTNAELQFTRDGVSIGELTYNYYTNNNNLYGINIQLNRSTNTKKPAYAGITAQNSDGTLGMKWVYVQDNATVGNYVAGTLNAGAHIHMNGFEILELGKLTFWNNNYINTWESTSTSEKGLYFSGVVSTEGRLLVGNQTYSDTTLKLAVTGKGYFNDVVITRRSFVKYMNPSRPTNGNFLSDNTGGMYMFLATSSMTSGKPHADGQVLQLNWDNSDSWAVQLAVTHNNGVLEHRYQNGTTWGSWYRVYSEAFKPTKSDVGLSNVSNVTPAQIINRLTTQSFTTGAVDVAANNSATGTLSVTKSGYTTIGVVGYDMSNYSGTGGTNVSRCSLGRCELSGNTVYYEVYNHGSNAAKVQVKFVVLYKQN